MLCADIGVVDNVVYMGNVNNRSKIYMFTIFYQANVVYMGIVSFHWSYGTALVKARGPNLSLSRIYTIVTSSFNNTNI